MRRPRAGLCLAVASVVAVLGAPAATAAQMFGLGGGAAPADYTAPPILPKAVRDRVDCIDVSVDLRTIRHEGRYTVTYRVHLRDGASSGSGVLVACGDSVERRALHWRVTWDGAEVAAKEVNRYDPRDAGLPDVFPRSDDLSFLTLSGLDDPDDTRIAFSSTCALPIAIGPGTHQLVASVSPDADEHLSHDHLFVNRQTAIDLGPLKGLAAGTPVHVSLVPPADADVRTDPRGQSERVELRTPVASKWLAVQVSDSRASLTFARVVKYTWILLLLAGGFALTWWRARRRALQGKPPRVLAYLLAVGLSVPLAVATVAMGEGAAVLVLRVSRGQWPVWGTMDAVGVALVSVPVAGIALVLLLSGLFAASRAGRRTPPGSRSGPMGPGPQG